MSEQSIASDSVIARVHDVAREVMRVMHAPHAGAKPLVTTVPMEHGPPQMLIEYFVDVPPSEAAAMSWDLADRLIALELETPGVAINFVGTCGP